MIKKFFAFILCLICLFSLVSCTKPGDTEYSSKYVDFEIVEINDKVLYDYAIWVDRATGVLYYHKSNSYGMMLTPLYNADGSLKNIKDFEN